MSLRVYVCGEVADGVRAACSGSCELPETGCGARFVPWTDTTPRVSGFQWLRCFSDGSQPAGYEGTAPDGTRYTVEGLGGVRARKGHQAKGPDGARIGPVCSKAVDAKAECEKHYKSKKEAA